MSSIICPMLSALKPVDEAGQPVNRECIYEQCRFFHLEKRDCTLMMASRAMLRLSEESAARPAAAAAPGPSGPDFEHRLTEMGRDLLSSSLEVQGVVREAGAAAIERVGGVEAKIDTIDAALGRRLQEMEERLAAGVQDRLAAMQERVGADVQARLAEQARASTQDRAEGEAIDALRGSLDAFRSAVEDRLRSAAARYEEQSRALADGGTIAAQVGAQVASLTELQQRVGERLLEEISLASASTRKLEQVVAALEKKVEKSVDESLGLSQLLTLVKGETERTFAALRGINEGNRAVIQAIETQLQRDQADLKRKRREEAQTCNNHGVVAYYRGAHEAAAEAFQQAIKLQPDFAEAHNNLGLALSRLGKEKAAVEAFQQALKLDPKMGEVYNNLGFLYHTASQFDRAVEMFGQAIQTSQDSSIAYTNLGNSFYQMKQAEKAVEAWRRALELDPMNENARRGLRMFQQDPGGN